MLSLMYVSCMQSLLAQSVLLSHNPRMCLRVSWMTFFDLQRSEHRVIHRVESFQKVSIFLLCYPVTQAGKQVSFFFELTTVFFGLSNSHFFTYQTVAVIHTRGPWTPTTPRPPVWRLFVCCWCWWRHRLCCKDLLQLPLHVLSVCWYWTFVRPVSHLARSRRAYSLKEGTSPAN